MTLTIAEQRPDETKALSIAGFPNIAALARCHTKFRDLDAVLGYNNAAHHWFSGKNNPGRAAETTAGFILEKIHSKENVKATPKSSPPIEVDPPKNSKDSTVFMVVCPPDKTAKIEKVLAMFGCEVVEV